jgi:hypothetical protein
MVTLNEVKNFLNNCKSEDGLTATISLSGWLKLYRFDGELMDDDVFIAKVDKGFNVVTKRGSTIPFNCGDGYLDDVETATVKDIAEAILCNIKIGLAEEMSLDIANIRFLDDVCLRNGMRADEVTTCNGEKFGVYHSSEK